VALVAIVLMGIVLLLQYALSAGVSLALADSITPTLDKAAQLTLEQTTASGALDDYIMLRRDQSLDDYRQAIGRATTLLDELRDEANFNAEISDQVSAARAAQRAWVKTDAEPAITLMEAGKRPRAMRETNSDDSWAAYDAMIAASSTVRQSLNDLRDQTTDALGTVIHVFGISLIIVGALVLVGLALFYGGLRAWVLNPLLSLRDDLQRAAREAGHTSPIRLVGPPEIKAVAADAEHLRRNLVHEIDQAQAAKEGLVQDAPLVAAMQAELTAADIPEVPGLEIAGSSQSAEGVVAGDWWDAVQRPDGSVALTVADVSGHGPEASVTALRVRSIIRAGLIAGLPLDEVLQMAAGACSSDTHFVTAILIVLDQERGTLTWANAGHHPAIVVTRDKDSSLCEPTGPLVSSLGGEWGVRSRFFAPGDVVVAFTDGLVESRNADGDELESAKVSLFIRGMDAPVRENPEELITRLLAQVRHRAADWRRDDVTIIAAARRS
jgi:sigma-B regulation protein RsbU (phosphoserine phosphatase)